MSVFGASMDMSKAFDMVDWKQLFKTLLKRGVNPVYLRLLLYVYTSQKYTVKWGTAVAEFFSISNGVRQGGVSSGIFFMLPFWSGLSWKRYFSLRDIGKLNEVMRFCMFLCL